MSKRVSAAETGFLTVINAVVWFVYALTTAAVIFLAFMFALQMFGANPNQQFAQFIYRWGAMFIRPFRGLIPPTLLGGTSFVNWNALVAIAAYAVIGWLIGFVLSWVGRRLRVDRAAMNTPETPAPVAPTSLAPPAE